MRKNILIKGYFYHNLGDDLFVRIVAERYPEIRFFLYGEGSYRHTFLDLKNVKLCNASSILSRLINKVSRFFGYQNNMTVTLASKFCSAVVQVGGSIFFPNDKYYKSKIDWMVRLIEKKKDVFVIGCNFSRFEKDEFWQDHYEYFKKLNDICFRDSYSYRLFGDLPNVRMASDMVFNYRHPTPTVIKNDEKSIVISVVDFQIRPHLKEYNDAYAKKMVECINCFTKAGYQVKLMSFCRSEGDERMIKKIHKHPLLEQDSKEKLKQVRYRSDLKKALEEIDSCYAVLATRFHAMILGILLGKKVYTVCYSNKINNVIEDNGWEIGHCTIPEFKDIPSEEILNRLEKTDAQDVSDCIEDAQKQFLVLDAYINNINEE